MVAHAGQLAVVCQRLINRRAEPDVRGHPESPGSEALEHLPLGRGLPALRLADAPAVKMQPAARRYMRIMLPQRAGGGVAWVGEQRAPGVRLRLIESFEVSFGHHDFAAHFDHGRGSASSRNGIERTARTFGVTSS